MKSSVVVIVDEDSGIKISPDCFRERCKTKGPTLRLLLKMIK